jgi:hypothetical protein
MFFDATPWCGELLAISEFNAEDQLRRIAPYSALRVRRMLKNAQWIEQMYNVHIFGCPRVNREPASFKK